MVSKIKTDISFVALSPHVRRSETHGNDQNHRLVLALVLLKYKYSAVHIQL